MSHDVIEQKNSRKNKFIANFAKRTENSLLKYADEVYTFSKKDSQLIFDLYSIQAEEAALYIEPQALKLPYDKIELDNCFVFYGAWNRKENYEGLEWFLNEIYPKIQSKVFFKIIGGGLSDQLQKKINIEQGIEYLGFVDDPYTIIASANALIAPVLSGAGVKVKVIEALATGTPVIGTQIAMEGIDNFEIDKFQMLTTAESIEDYCYIIDNFGRRSKEFKIRAKEWFSANYCSSKIIDKIL